MKYVKIEKPQWLIDLENQEPPLLHPDDEADYQRRTTYGFYAPEGKNFPFIKISITYQKYDEPGIGQAVSLSVSMKYSVKDWLEKCSLPADLMGEYIKLVQEAYDKKLKE